MTLTDAIVAAGWATRPPSWDGARPRSGAGGDAGPAPSAVVQGVDIGGTEIHAAVWSPAEARVVEVRTATDPAGGAAVLEQVASLVHGLADGSPVARLAVGLPGTIVPHTGRLELAPNLPGWDRLDVSRELERRCGAPVEVLNDVNLAAWGEHVWTGERELVFIAVGTGVGAGVVHEGHIVRGAGGAAGEIYDIPLPPGASQAEASTLEDLACGPGLAREYRARTGRGLTPRQILACVREDSDAAAAVATVTAAVATLVAAVHSLLDPEMIVLGGGLGSRPEIIGGVAEQLAAFGRRPVSLRSSLLGSRASTVGALARARAALDADRPHRGTGAAGDPGRVEPA